MGNVKRSTRGAVKYQAGSKHGLLCFRRRPGGAVAVAELARKAFRGAHGSPLLQLEGKHDLEGSVWLEGTTATRMFSFRRVQVVGLVGAREQDVSGTACAEEDGKGCHT